MSIKTYEKIETVVLYFVIKKQSWNKLPKRARTWDYILETKRKIEQKFIYSFYYFFSYPSD